MKKKLLLCLVLLMALFVGCGKKSKEEEKEGVFGKLQSEQKVGKRDIVDENVKKYNAYVDLYNSLVNNENPIAKFDTEYITLFTDDEGKFKKPTQSEGIESFGVNVESTFVEYDNILENAKRYMNQKPEYVIDKNIAEIARISEELKGKIIEIGNYYTNKSYIDDNFAKGEKYDEEYEGLYQELVKYSDEFMVAMEEIEDQRIESLLAQYEENGQTALLNIQIFKVAMDIFSNVLYNRDEYKFSADDLETLKKTNETLLKAQAKLEELSNEELERDGISASSYKTNYIKKTKELTEYATSVVSHIEQNKSEKEIEEKANGFLNAYSKVIDAYNSMVNQ